MSRERLRVSRPSKRSAGQQVRVNVVPRGRSFAFAVKREELGLAPGPVIVVKTLAEVQQLLRSRATVGFRGVVGGRQVYLRNAESPAFVVKREEFGLPPGPDIIARNFFSVQVLLRRLRLYASQGAQQKRLLVRPNKQPAIARKKSFPSKSEGDALLEISDAAFAPGPRAKALIKGIEIAQEDLRSSGGAYDLEQVRKLLHDVSRQRVDKRVREGSLLAVPGPSNKRRYPTIQFMEDGTVVEGLQMVRIALPTKNDFAILNFLIHPDQRLGNRKPIDLLKAGEVNLVVEAARRVGEQGA